MDESELESRVRKLENTKALVLGGGVVGGLLILAFLGITSYVRIPALVTEEVTRQIGPVVLEEIQRARDTAEESARRATEFAALAEIALANIEGGLLRIESGTVRADESRLPDLRRTDYCENTPENSRGLVMQRVQFDRPFAETPTVVVALAYLDHIIDAGHLNNLRIRAAVREVDPNGFDFDLNTWCNTDIYAVEMTWVAYGRSAP